ncbi:nucleoside deaminase [Bacteroidetes/Chlorobi group bacterium ChocPot_Mid]|jgi:tRNA(adenine34) deaminase|nr:MAG: nucleoside deaminase [Bacteroidetes/Chlorobi group bacterium ChocPot_Mid]
MPRDTKFTRLQNNYDDEVFMREALIEAEKALKSNDVPIGAVVVRNGIIIGRGFNKVEKKQNSIAHAELVAIKKALSVVNSKHLLQCSLYVTLEPCSMCSGAIVLSRLKRLVYGAKDPKSGASGSLFSITDDNRLNHRCIVTGGVLEKECSKLLTDFFKQLRKQK